MRRQAIGGRRKALRGSATGQRVVATAAFPPATGGWDTLSPKNAMPRDHAVVLDNWFPEAGSIRIRNGYDIHTDVGSGNVESLMVYNGLTANNMFAASGSVIYDVSSQFLATSALTSLSNARWQYVNFTTSGGHFLVICNGADAPRTFDGSNWATPAITVVDETNFINVAAHKKRLWFTLVNSTKAAYMPLDSIAGAATEFDFGAVFSQGGVLQAIGTWTRDGGDGPDDYLVAISSRGQAAIYQGTNPADSTAWGLVGVHNLPPPIGRRCMLKTGTDLAIITISGVISLEAALSKDRAAAATYSLMPAIQPSVTSAAQSYGTNFGWELIAYPRGTAAFLNVPITSNGSAYQYGINTLTGAPFRYTGMDAQCWALYNDNIYFGTTNGQIFQADTGAQDFTGPLDADVQGAFWDFRAPGENKQVTMVQPLLLTDGAVVPSLAINTDFSTDAPTSPLARTAAAGSIWGSFEWGTGIWGDDISSQADWVAESALGQWISVRMRVSVHVDTTGARFDVSAFDVGTFDNLATQPITLRCNGFNVMYERGIGL